MIRDLFLDLDDTLLDFGEAERHGILRTLRELGIAPTEETLALYSRINQQQWERFERGEIPREQVLIERFSLLFQAVGMWWTSRGWKVRVNGCLCFLSVRDGV